MTKTKTISIFLIVALAAVLIVPLAIYGSASVSTVEVNSSFSIGGDPSGAGEVFVTQIGGSYDVSEPEVDIKVIEKNAWEHGFNRLFGNDVSVEDGQQEGGSGIGSIVAEITFSMVIMTPSGQEINLDFNPHELQGMGQKDIILILNQDDLQNEKGTFTMNLTISIKITPPVMETPIINMQFDIGQRTFTIE